MDIQKHANTEKSSEDNSSKSFLYVFVTTFSTVFLAELGDKTQIATMLLTVQSRMPVVVFAGAALALICSSLVGVLLGRWLSKTMPAERFNYLAGILMVCIGILLGIQSTHSLIRNLPTH